MDGIFDLAQRILQGREALDGAELRVGFGEREQAFQRAGQHVFGLGLVGRAGGAHGAIAGVDDGFKSAFLVAGVALDGLDEVGDEVVAPLELDVDVSPGVVRGDLETNQAVIHPDQDENDQDNAGENDPTDHGKTSRKGKVVCIGDEANIRGADASVKAGRQAWASKDGALGRRRRASAWCLQSRG